MRSAASPLPHNFGARRNCFRFISRDSQSQSIRSAKLRIRSTRRPPSFVNFVLTKSRHLYWPTNWNLSLRSIFLALPSLRFRSLIPQRTVDVLGLDDYLSTGGSGGELRGTTAWESMMIGQSVPMRRIMNLIERVPSSDVQVLITGES